MTGGGAFPVPQGPRHVKYGINRLLRGLGAPPADVLRAALEQWPEVAGTPLAAHARPVRLVHRQLVINVDDPAWAAELRLREGELIERLTERLGGAQVRSIRVRVTGRRRDRDGPPGR